MKNLQQIFNRLKKHLVPRVNCCEPLTCEFWEVGGHVRVHDLLLQDVCLIKKENHRRLLEPRICDDGFKQSFTLLHAILKHTRPFQIQSTAMSMRSQRNSLDEDELKVHRPRCHIQPGPGRTRSEPPGRWWRWRSQSSGSTSCARIAAPRRPPSWWQLERRLAVFNQLVTNDNWSPN